MRELPSDLPTIGVPLLSGCFMLELAVVVRVPWSGDSTKSSYETDIREHVELGRDATIV
jgi:hypothetical protein